MYMYMYIYMYIYMYMYMPRLTLVIKLYHDALMNGSVSYHVSYTRVAICGPGWGEEGWDPSLSHVGMMMLFLLSLCCATLGLGRGVGSWAAMDVESYGYLCGAAAAGVRHHTGNLPWRDGWLGAVSGSHEVVFIPAASS